MTLSPLGDRTYRRLFAAQVVALVGTGVSTVALALIAYELAGAQAGVVLGVALALKMVSYVGLSPVIAAYAHRVPRRGLLIGLDLLRAAAVLAIAFTSEVWHLLVLILLLHACSAGFTPAFQATIPDILPDEGRYTRALSLSRLAYDLADLLSPALAAALLLSTDAGGLFAINGVAFLVSAALVAATRLPARGREPVSDRTWARITFGARRYLRTPRLRGLLALNVAVAAASAMVIVNTVVLVRDEYGAGGSAVAVALGCAGAGSMAAALLLPRILDRVADRPVMLAGGAVLVAGLAATAVVPSYPALLATWVVLGAGMSLVQTPAGRLLRRSGDASERPALFAAQFSLTHACWLLTYPVAGVLGTVLGIHAIAVALAAVAAAAVLAAASLWRPHEPTARGVASGDRPADTRPDTPGTAPT